MPRPVVEVHQSILNPVVTVTDPQSQVCLVGLNTKSFTSESSPQSYDFATSWADPSQAPTIAPNIVFDVASSEGPVISDDLDLGNGHVVSGDVSVDVYNVSVVVDGALASLSSSFRSITSPDITTYLTNNPEVAVSDLSVVAAPQADYLTKLTLQNNGLGLDLTTGKLADGDTLIDFRFDSSTTYQLGNAGGVTADSEFKVRKVESGALYVEPTTPNTFLSGGALASEAELYLYDADGDIVFGPANVPFFDLEHAGVERVQLLERGDAENEFLVSETITLSLPASLTHFGFLERSISEVVNISAASDVPLLTDPQGDGSVEVTMPQGSMVDSDGNIISKASYGANYSIAATTYSDRVYQLTDSTGLGVASEQNPLALAHRVARANSGTTPVGVLALDISPVAGSDELKSLAQAHAEALRILEASPELYAYVPLTDSLSQLVAYKNSAEAMSVPAKGKFRIVLGASEGAPEFDYLVGTPDSPASCATVAGALNDVEGAFRTNGVRVGDSVTLLNSDQAVVKVGTVSARSSEQLTVTWTGGNPADGVYGYYVARNIATPQGRGRQIELLTGRLAGIASPRLVMVYPGSVNVSVTGSTIQDLPGYYGSAALAGLVASLEPHRPKNQIGLAGINGLDNSNFRFSEDEIDQISDAGYFVLVQETRDGAPFCVHQVTTQYGVSQGTQELTELSVVANFDFVSRYFKKILVPYVGTHNIVPSVLGSIRGSLESGIANLRSRNADRIGSPILSGSIEVLRQASYDSGTVEASISVSLPKVLNRIIIEVVSA